MVKMEELYNLLCSDGFLPPRNEEELLETEKRIAGYQLKNDNRHVDAKAIISGVSCNIINMKSFDDNIASQSFGMAARNFEQLPQSVIDKIKTQHQKR